MPLQQVHQILVKWESKLVERVQMPLQQVHQVLVKREIEIDSMLLIQKLV
jgi:hypothetical protein